MKFLDVFILAATTCVLCVDARKNWALLIAGSSGYDNYRHQANICHAYQIMHKAGIPDEQIVVMMYDDIAENEENPYKGNIINKPDGPNVYPGVLKDYTGQDITVKTFLAVLQGNKEEVRKLIGREGKVIESGPDDYIFVNYVDHGGPGILEMPNPPLLKAREVNEALKKMHAQKKFAKLVFYVEACESGSIFHNLLPKNINVYVTTAANATEPSYPRYYDDKRQTYLGDYYSGSWMDNVDTGNLQTETLETQYELVKKETTPSHVQQYGDLSIDALTLDKFFGNNQQDSKRKNTLTWRSNRSTIDDGVPSEMVELYSLRKRIEAAAVNSIQRAKLEKKLANVLTTMEKTNKLFWDIARTVYSGLPDDAVYDLTLKDHNNIENWDCYEIAVDTLLAFCPGLNTTTNGFALRRFYVLVNICNSNSENKVILAVEAATAANDLCRI